MFEGDGDQEWCVLIWERAKVDGAHGGLGLGVSPDEVGEPDSEPGRGGGNVHCGCVEEVDT